MRYMKNLILSAGYEKDKDILIDPTPYLLNANNKPYNLFKKV